jgi:hypothetical protein
MFDRVTGFVNPVVAQYWRDHYDLAHLVKDHWTAQHDLIKGRIHLIVGTADTFYLDGAVRLLDKQLQELGAQAHVAYIPSRTHFDLFRVGTDELGLYDEIAKQMYAVARPTSAWLHAGWVLPSTYFANGLQLFGRKMAGNRSLNLLSCLLYGGIEI